MARVAARLSPSHALVCLLFQTRPLPILQGAAQQQALRWGTAAAPSAAALNSRAGTLSFFSSGSGGGAFVSENGLAEAAMFHQLARWARSQGSCKA